MPEKGKRVTVTSKRQITLPATLCKEMGIERGDQLEIQAGKNEIRLKPAPRFPVLTRKSSLFRLMGSEEGPGGSGAREHDRIIAAEARPDQTED